MNNRPRIRGSVRFDPYYKVQWWDERNLAWHDVQIRYDTVAGAMAAFISGKRCRVIEITETGRRSLT